MESFPGGRGRKRMDGSFFFWFVELDFFPAHLSARKETEMAKKWNVICLLPTSIDLRSGGSSASTLRLAELRDSIYEWMAVSI